VIPKRLSNTDGRPLVLQADTVAIQGRDGAVPLLKATRSPSRSSSTPSQTSTYSGDHVADATSITIEIVRKHPEQVGFAVHPRRWVVERLFAWLNRNRRLAKDFKASIASAEAFLHAASVMLLARRLANAS
jgi:putative transposase